MSKHLISKTRQNKELGAAKSAIKKQIYYIGRFRHEIGRKFTKPEIECLADEMLAYMEPEADNLWLPDFFSFRHIAPKTIASLCELSDYFAECYEIAMAIQEGRLVKAGMKSNSAMPIFCLKCRHKWNEKAEDDDNETVGIINNWPTEEDEAEAFDKLKDERVRDAMLDILRQQAQGKRWPAQQQGSG